ncbi:THP3-like protein C2A9.11c [Diplonema papillatum]|nr:THP3-like protein C2A9.11c [Diplonema papillatum]
MPDRPGKRKRRAGGDDVSQDAPEAAKARKAARRTPETRGQSGSRLQDAAAARDPPSPPTRKGESNRRATSSPDRPLARPRQGSPSGASPDNKTSRRTVSATPTVNAPPAHGVVAGKRNKRKQTAADVVCDAESEEAPPPCEAPETLKTRGSQKPSTPAGTPLQSTRGAKPEPAASATPPGKRKKRKQTAADVFCDAESEEATPPCEAAKPLKTRGLQKPSTPAGTPLQSTRGAKPEPAASATPPGKRKKRKQTAADVVCDAEREEATPPCEAPETLKTRGSQKPSTPAGTAGPPLKKTARGARLEPPASAEHGEGAPPEARARPPPPAAAAAAARAARFAAEAALSAGRTLEKRYVRPASTPAPSSVRGGRRLWASLLHAVRRRRAGFASEEEGRSYTWHQLRSIRQDAVVSGQSGFHPMAILAYFVHAEYALRDGDVDALRSCLSMLSEASVTKAGPRLLRYLSWRLAALSLSNAPGVDTAANHLLCAFRALPSQSVPASHQALVRSSLAVSTHSVAGDYHRLTQALLSAPISVGRVASLFGQPFVDAAYARILQAYRPTVDASLFQPLSAVLQRDPAVFLQERRAVVTGQTVQTADSLAAFHALLKERSTRRDFSDGKAREPV